MSLVERFLEITHALIAIDERSSYQKAPEPFNGPSELPMESIKPEASFEELQKELRDFEELIGLRSSTDQPSKEELEEL